MADLKPIREVIYHYEVGNAHEGQGVPSRYDVVVWKAWRVLPPWERLSTMRVDEVQDWQREAIRAYRQKHKSEFGFSAAGAPQILRSTLVGLEDRGVIRGGEVFGPDVQDRCCDDLIRRRGFGRYAAGDMSAADFADQLAREWASLPVTRRQQGAHRIVEPGQSYYAGDGVNAAKCKPKTILAAIEAATGPAAPAVDMDAALALIDGATWRIVHRADGRPALRLDFGGGVARERVMDIAPAAHVRMGLDLALRGQERMTGEG